MGRSFPISKRRAYKGRRCTEAGVDCAQCPFVVFAILANATVECVPPTLVAPQELEVEPIAAATISCPAINPQQVVDMFMAAVDRFRHPLTYCRTTSIDQCLIRQKAFGYEGCRTYNGSVLDKLVLLDLARSYARTTDVHLSTGLPV